MTNSEDSARQVTIERREIFRPAWFKKLLTGQLSLGDTFWIGNYGIGLFAVPAIIFPYIIAKVILPSAIVVPLFFILILGMAAYHLILTTAVWKTARATPEVGGWRWAGVVFTLINAVLACFVASTLVPSL